MTKLNSRQKRKFRSYGMTASEAVEVLAELKKMESKPKREHCSYMDYHKSDERQKNILRQARALGLGGKHIGSKPLGKIEQRLRSMEKMLARYSAAFKAMKRIEDRQNGENN